MAKHPSDRIIDRHERRQLVPYSDTHVLRLERAGRFPVRVQLGSNRVGWLLSEILAWIGGEKAIARSINARRASLTSAAICAPSATRRLELTNGDPASNSI